MKGIFFYLLIGAALYLSYVEKSKADFASDEGDIFLSTHRSSIISVICREIQG